MEQNWSRCTGPRSSAMLRSPITFQMQLLPMRHRSFRLCRAMQAQETEMAMSRQLCYSVGAQEMNQQMITYAASLDYMTDAASFQQVQNGIDTGLQNQLGPQRRYLNNGRAFGAYTHLDVLYQAYFTAYLVLNTLGVPLNPGNPYVNSNTQNGFGTFGQPDFAATVAAVAGFAINCVWYPKWYVHLRHRPESGGAIVRQILTGHGGTLNGRVNDNVLNSMAVQR